MKMTLSTSLNVAYSRKGGVVIKDMRNTMVDDDSDYEEVAAVKAKPWY